MLGLMFGAGVWKHCGSKRARNPRKAVVAARSDRLTVGFRKRRDPQLRFTPSARRQTGCGWRHPAESDQALHNGMPARVLAAGRHALHAEFLAAVHREILLSPIRPAPR